MSKMLLTIMMIAAPLSLMAQAPQNASASADAGRSASAACSDFTTYELIDPNSPCFAEIRPDLDPRSTEGEYFDANTSTTPKLDECNGCHVQPSDLTSNSIENIYEIKFLKSAVPQFDAPAETGGHDEKPATK